MRNFFCIRSGWFTLSIFLIELVFGQNFANDSMKEILPTQIRCVELFVHWIVSNISVLQRLHVAAFHSATHDWKESFEQLVAYTRFHQLGSWQMLTQDRPLWMQLSDNLVEFCSTRWGLRRFNPCMPLMSNQRRVGPGNSETNLIAGLFTPSLRRTMPRSVSEWDHIVKR